VGSDGLIYAIGGNSGSNIVTVEAYNPATNTWTTRASMPTGRVGLGAASAGGLIYAIGGDSSTGTQLTTVEAYSAASNLWW